MNSIRTATLIILATASLSSRGAAQQPPPPATEVGAAGLALATLPAKNSAKLTVTSPIVKPGGDIPFENTQYRGNVFPGLSWTAGPANTKSYAIIMQDGDGAKNGMPYLHWTMFNIPATVTKLDSAMTTPPTGSQYGQNYKGTNQPYLGPRTPAGPKHRYHFQVFALDTSLKLEPTATYTDLTDAMKGHVLVSGELVGLGQAPAQK